MLSPSSQPASMASATATTLSSTSSTTGSDDVSLINPSSKATTPTPNHSANNKKNNETTLTHLTKRFVKLLNANSERVVNLNEASTRLCVAKRRIYDITNVLEGIGLLKKISKNVTRWIDCPRDSPFAAPPNNHHHLITSSTNNTTSNNVASNTANANLQPQDVSVDLKQIQGLNLKGLRDAEFLSLLKTYQLLEEGVNDLEAKIRQQLGADGAYVTYHDIKSFFNDQIVIAVKAPPETRLEVNESLQIWMKSENGEIEVYLCPQYGNNTSNTNNLNNNDNSNNINSTQQQNGYQSNTSPHLQQSQLSNSSNTQQLETNIIDNSTTINGQQVYTTISSDEGRGRSTISTTDGQYYDPTSGVSNDEHYYNNNPTLSSALSGSVSEEEEPFTPLVPYEAHDATSYNFMLDDCSLTVLFAEENLGIY